MKKIIFLGVVLILASLSVSAQTLRVSMIGQDPDPVRAGDVVEARFKIENLFEDTKGEVLVKILPEYPFSLYSSSNTQNFGILESRKYGSSDAIYFDFKLKVDQDAVDGYHEIVLQLNDDQTTWDLEDKFYVEIKNEKILLKPYVVSSDLITGGKKGTFTIEIANAGGEDIESLQLELLNSPDYKLLSTSEYVYIGNLEADDTESEDFSVYVDEDKTSVGIPLKLTYEVNDKEYQQDFLLSLNLLTKSEAKKIGLITTSYTPVIITIIVLVIVLVVIIRRYRRK